MTYFLDIEFHKSKRGLLMHQIRHALDILKKFKIDYCNASITLVEPRLHLSKKEDEKHINLTQYMGLIGSLRYLCNSQLDLAFSIDIVSRFMETQEVSRLAEVKRILRYVKGSIVCGILFHAADTDKKCNLLGFIDSNWYKNKDDRKSIIRYIFMFSDTPIS